MTKAECPSSPLSRTLGEVPRKSSLLADGNETVGRLARPLGEIAEDDFMEIATGVKLSERIGALIDDREALKGLAEITSDFEDRIAKLLEKREVVQGKIDALLENAKGEVEEVERIMKDEKTMLDAGFLHEEAINVGNGGAKEVDQEIRVSGPQLVVPLDNLRFAVNALNARWMSLLDCLMASGDLCTEAVTHDPDILDPICRAVGGADDMGRARAVVSKVLGLLDDWVPLRGQRWSSANQTITRFIAGDLGEENPLYHDGPRATTCQDGIRGMIFYVRDLRVWVQVDASAVLYKVMVEAVPTAILDAEDSVCCVDAADKARLYRNFEAIYNGTAKVEFKRENSEVPVKRTLIPPFTASLEGTGMTIKIPSTALPMVRVCGLSMKSEVLQLAGMPVTETIIDLFTFSYLFLKTRVSFEADQMHQAAPHRSTGPRLYVVVPKLHGPEEAGIITEICKAIENRLSVLFEADAFNIYIGIMDEERRTSANLAATIEATAGRAFFVNTGFLDRTGDEIFTSRMGGVFPTRADIKNAPWLQSYELLNVVRGMKSNVPQIGKGMWPEPDNMLGMLQSKGAHVRAGATCAWVPSPKAAAIHFLHYADSSMKMDNVNTDEEVLREQLLTPSLWSSREVGVRTAALAQKIRSLGGEAELLGAILEGRESDVVAEEVLSCVQAVMGYASRWINLGVGCSKIRNLKGVGLMEDRATLRISSQLLGNWLIQGLVTKGLVQAALDSVKCRIEVDNCRYPEWLSLMDHDSIAMEAVKRLCIYGWHPYNRYTEPLLNEYRRKVKRNRL